MSEYPAWMQPVPFPTASAEAARSACDEVAAVLNEDLLVRPELVSSARDGWEGTYRDDFDEEWSSQETSLSALQTNLRTLATHITNALEAASTVNAQRAEMRAGHDPEAEVPGYDVIGGPS